MNLRFGRYETIKAIAQGGMATVYLGRAVGAGGFERRVAIKVMHDHIAADPDFITMFLDEARLAARIHHPNVVGTIDVQKTDEGMFLVMDFIDGPSLRDVLREQAREGRSPPVGVAVRIMMDVLAGLHEAHELEGNDHVPLNLVHRDVSPHNVLVGLDGITRITDFGVARAEARLSSTKGGQLKGKIAYMAPEQGRGDEIDRRADVYAAGVVLWETLTCRKLFHAEHEGALVAMILTGAERSPRDVAPHIPVEIDDVCMKGLAHDPNDRYPTALDFADALEKAARAAGVDIATTREVAAFVESFESRVDTMPPPPEEMVDEASRPVTTTGMRAPPPQSVSQPSVGGVSAATSPSQMSTVGAVLPTDPPATQRRGVVIIGAAAAAVLGMALAAVVVPRIAGGGAESAASSAGKPNATPATTSEHTGETEKAFPRARRHRRARARQPVRARARRGAGRRRFRARFENRLAKKAIL
jgi:serine/threonine-protein kinase